MTDTDYDDEHTEVTERSPEAVRRDHNLAVLSDNIGRFEALLVQQYAEQADRYERSYRAQLAYQAAMEGEDEAAIDTAEQDRRVVLREINNGVALINPLELAIEALTKARALID